MGLEIGQKGLLIGNSKLVKWKNLVLNNTYVAFPRQNFLRFIIKLRLSKDSIKKPAKQKPP